MVMDYTLQTKTSKVELTQATTDKPAMLETLVLLVGLIVLIIGIRGMSGL